jgi:hypothetical protein
MMTISSGSVKEAGPGSPSPYAAYVKAQSSRYPSLLNLYTFLCNPKSGGDGCRIVAIDFRKGLANSDARENITPDDLDAEIEPPHPDYDKDHTHSLDGRMLIIEDLSKGVVETLASQLDIDPLFFALHLSTVQKERTRSQSPDEASLPSRLLSQDFMNLSYHHAVTSDKTGLSEHRYCTTSAIQRKLVFIAPTTIGLERHCASVLLIKRKSFWIGT